MPLIRTMENCTPEEKTLIENGVKKRDADSAAEIMKLINRYDGIQYSLQRAKEGIEEAKGVLSSFPESRAKEALFAIADYVVARRM
jgi:octaprenyl-diphosphate synthase